MVYSAVRRGHCRMTDDQCRIRHKSQTARRPPQKLEPLSNSSSTLLISFVSNEDARCRGASRWLVDHQKDTVRIRLNSQQVAERQLQGPLMSPYIGLVNRPSSLIRELVGAVARRGALAFKFPATTEPSHAAAGFPRANAMQQTRVGGDDGSLRLQTAVSHHQIMASI